MFLSKSTFIFIFLGFIVLFFFPAISQAAFLAFALFLASYVIWNSPWTKLWRSVVTVPQQSAQPVSDSFSFMLHNVIKHPNEIKGPYLAEFRNGETLQDAILKIEYFKSHCLDLFEPGSFCFYEDPQQEHKVSPSDLATDFRGKEVHAFRKKGAPKNNRQSTSPLKQAMALVPVQSSFSSLSNSSSSQTSSEPSSRVEFQALINLLPPLETPPDGRKVLLFIPMSEELDYLVEFVEKTLKVQPQPKKVNGLAFYVFEKFGYSFYCTSRNAMGNTDASGWVSLCVERIQPFLCAILGIAGAGNLGAAGVGQVVLGRHLWTYDANSKIIGAHPMKEFNQISRVEKITTNTIDLVQITKSNGIFGNMVTFGKAIEGWSANCIQRKQSILEDPEVQASLAAFEAAQQVRAEQVAKEKAEQDMKTREKHENVTSFLSDALKMIKEKDGSPQRAEEAIAFISATMETLNKEEKASTSVVNFSEIIEEKFPNPFNIKSSLIACGNAVCKCGMFRDSLLELKPELLAIAMEETGFITGISQAANKFKIDILVIRGISDPADETKNAIETVFKDKLRWMAFGNAADFLFTVLKTNAEIERILDQNSSSSSSS